MTDWLATDVLDFDGLYDAIGDEARRPRCLKCRKPVDGFFGGMKRDNLTEFVAILCHGETKQIERIRPWRPRRADLCGDEP